jgi:hypothetical protein
MRYAARVDSNQKAIVDCLRRMGAVVWVIGLPVDLLVGYRGKTYLVEVKAGKKKKFTSLQVEFFERWNGDKLVRIESPNDALTMLEGK